MIMQKIFLFVGLFFGGRINSIVSQSLPPMQNRTCCIKDQKVFPCFNKCTARTCRNVLNPPQVCTLECGLNICQCREGLFLNDCNQCVVKELCYFDCVKSMPIKCKGPHETIYGCLKPSERRVCSNPIDMMINAITTHLINSTIPEELCTLNVCDCVDGYFRNRCGKCVPLSECDKNCCDEFKCREQNTQLIPIHSKDSRCGKCSTSGCDNECKDCENDCDDDKCDYDDCDQKCKRKCKKCKICKKHQNCPHTCACKPGYAKNKCGICVPIIDVILDIPCACTNPCTIPNTEWLCTNKCTERTCQNYHEQPKLCELSCSYGCSCSANKNLWFNGTACVLGSMCPPPIITHLETQIHRPIGV